MADRDDIIAHHAAGTPPELFVERMHRHRSDEIGKAFRATLMNLHNDGTIDALEPARTIGASSIDQHQFFTVMHVYCDLIPALEAEVPAMLAAVKTLVARAGADGASGMLVEDRTYDGRRYRMLNVIDEFTHECLAIRVARKLKAIDVIDVLSDLFILRGVPGHVRSDNGPEFVAEAVQAWITAVGAKTAYIERGSPWENGYIESFNARLRDELLNGEIFYTLREAQIVIESWRRHYNTIRPHASIGYKPPAPEVFVPAFAAWPAALRRPAPPATLAQRPALN